MVLVKLTAAGIIQSFIGATKSNRVLSATFAACSVKEIKYMKNLKKEI